ncbi:MAG TPA: TrmH family RNA methyltransferase, partial [Methylophilaceae bacterium]
LARTMRELKDAGIWLLGAAMETESDLFSINMPSAVGIVLGAEGHGLRRLTAEICDALVRIPMLGSVESLNVSVASGICLYEARRQRTSKNG